MDRKPSDTPFALPTFDAFAGAALNPFAPLQAAPPEVANPAEAVWSHDVDDAGEDELPGADAVNVRVRWGTNVLHFSQLSPPRAFTLGGVGSDFVFPDAFAGASSGGSSPLVSVRDGEVAVCVPPAASALVQLRTGRTSSLKDAIGAGLARPSDDRSGAYEVPLGHGTAVTVRLPASDLVIEVSRVRASRNPAAGVWGGADLSGYIYTGLSAAVHATLIGALAFFLPGMHADDAESIDRDTAAAMRPYLDAIAEKEPEHSEAAAQLDPVGPSGGGRGGQAAGPSGSMGSTVAAPARSGRYALRGDTPDAKLARERAIAEAAQFGFVGILNTDAANSVNTPVAPWGADSAAGHDPSNALGAMWAPTIDDALGSGGLGPSGTGEGGGGFAHGIGIDGISDTIGHGTGEWPGDGPGRGPGHDYGPGGHGGTRGGLRPHTAGAPNPRALPITTFNGTLPKEVVQRIVRQNFGRFRLCYEAGLRANPGLTGRVAVAFVIDRSGGVAVASADRSTDMADPNVVSCVVRGFQNLSFPAPKDGIVQVIYPLMLSPGE